MRFEPTKQIAHFLSGHGPYDFYLHRFKKRNDPNCDICGQTEDTVMHILNCRPGLKTLGLNTVASLQDALKDENTSRNLGQALLEYEHEKEAEEAQAKAAAQQQVFLVDTTLPKGPNGTGCPRWLTLRGHRQITLLRRTKDNSPQEWQRRLVAKATGRRVFSPARQLPITRYGEHVPRLFHGSHT